MRRCSFVKTIGARRKLLSRIKEAREREINKGDHCQRPKPARQSPPLIMPDRRGDDQGEGHRKHEFPGEIHNLIDASARKRPTHPNVNKKQRTQLQEKPKIGWNKVERSDR